MAIYDFYEPGQLTDNLFAESTGQCKDDKFTVVIDQVNQKFVAGKVQTDSVPSTKAGFLGIKIDFCRIPEEEEFRELR